MAHIKNHKDRKTRKSKAKACLFSSVSSIIFTRIMSLKSTKFIWDYLKVEYKGDERIRDMQVLNLIRDFEMQKMKENETIYDYSEKLLNIANSVRLLGSEFSNSHIIETNLVNVVMREEGNNEEALPAKHQDGGRNKKKKNKKNQPTNNEGISANATKVVICKNNGQQQEADTQIVDGEEKDQIFVAIYFSSRSSSECWLINNGCTNHMTNDKALFKELKPTTITKVRIGNGEHIIVREKRSIVIPSHSNTKTISDVLYVPDIDQNLLSVGQLMEKGYKLTFEDKHYLIKDVSNQELFKVKMRGKVSHEIHLRRSMSFFQRKKVRQKYGTRDLDIFTMKGCSKCKN
ncbi:uncharacterized protein LOC142176105 [Nicotiana tabacum]|uniref:Uncharacterized protein LOC142176105 n=1 Tax=Nicotiana tabacum TaxID=4097 RepID=A0AC58TPY0_TOBAC